MDHNDLIMSSHGSGSSAIVDFIVDIPHGKDIVVLQLTDTQIIDASQARSPTRLCAQEKIYWAKDQLEERCFQYLRHVINTVAPNLILLTGDLVYGEFDDSGSSLIALIEFLESFGIPWAPVFGNHDNESLLGADWQCQQLINSSHCLFAKRPLNGCGNYTVGLRQDGLLKRVFFMLNSNSYILSKNDPSKRPKVQYGFNDDQIDWYTATVHSIREVSPMTRFSFAFHTQLQSFADAFAKYGFTNHNTNICPIEIDSHPDAASGDFGYLGANLKNGWDMDRRVWNSLKSLVVDSVFVGHEHCNSASVVYEGVRCQYGQKSSTYDRANYYNNGKIIGSYTQAGQPIVGGTVIPLASDGSLLTPYICYATIEPENNT